MAELSSKHVTWSGLQYYDSKIKSYIDEVVERLEASSTTDEELEAIKSNLLKVSELSLKNQGKIDELFNNYSETRSNFETLFASDKRNAENIRGLEERLKEVTKAVDLETVKGDLKLVQDDLNEVVSQLETDHKTIEEILITLENVALEDELTGVTNELGELEAQVEQIAQEYASKEYVAEQVSKVVIPDVDLSDYYNKSETDAAISTAIKGIQIPEVDLEPYATKNFVVEQVANLATKEELEEAINSIEHPTVNLDGYATEDWVNEQGFLKEHQDLSEYAKKSDVPSIEGLATEDFVKSEIAKAELNGGEVTEEELNNLLANYYNKSEVNALIPDVTGFATKTEVEAVQNVAGSNSVKLFAIESDLVDISNELENVPTTYATKEEVTAVNAKVDAIVIPEVPTKVSELENDAGYVTAKDIPETDLSNYYNKAETETLIAEAVKDIEHPTVDLEGYATEAWVNEQGFIKEVPSEYITESELDAKGYLTEHQDISGKADKSDLEGLASVDYVDQAIANIPETDVSNLATKEELQTVEAKIPTDYLTSIPEEYITKQELDSEGFVTSLDGYATEQFVTEAISNIKHPDPDLSNYFTKDETTSAINEAIEGIQIPEVDLEPYATKAQVVEQVATKANNIPFTADIFVTTAQGGFINGDNLKGMTVEAILTKLLGLQQSVTPDEPEDPDAPQTLVDKIITEQIPMYSIKDYRVTEVPYQLHTYDATTKNAPITTSGFYQVLDDSGNIIEAGYQDVTINKGDVYYIIAFPKFIDYNTMVTLQVYDEMNSMWVTLSNSDKLVMVNDEEYIKSICSEEPQMYLDDVDTNEYTLWMCEEPPTGSHYRFVINE